MATQAPNRVILRPVEIFRYPRRHEGAVSVGRGEPSYSAFELLYLGYIGGLILAGLAKFMPGASLWPGYVDPAFLVKDGITPVAFIQGCGVVEILLGLWVAWSPAAGGVATFLWLWREIVELWMYPEIGFGGFMAQLLFSCMVLSLGALALSLQSDEYLRRKESNASRP